MEETDTFAEIIGLYFSIHAVVEVGDEFADALVGYVDVIEVECGLRDSDQAAENAVELVYEFLATIGAIDDPIDPSGALPARSINLLSVPIRRSR